MSDNHKVMKDLTGQKINERLREIRNAIAAENKAQTGVIYGFHIDAAESDPEDKVTYIAQAVGMTPAKMNYTTGVFDYGSWEDAFFMPKPCMLKNDGTVDYYLNPYDYTKKLDGTASDVANTAYAGNAMMEWGQNGRKIWYKIVPDSNAPQSANVYVADYQADDDYVAYSFINAYGDYVDHFYTPIYNGTIVNNVVRSLSGIAGTSLCKNTDAATERTMARANNASLPIWDTEVFADITLINILLVLMAKSTDSQTAYGQGLINSGSEEANNGFTTGVHNTRGLFYGTNSGTATTYTNAVKVFGMENWWGLIWRRFGGLVNDNGTFKYKMTRGRQDGSSVDDYVVSTASSDYNGYLTGCSVPGEGWQREYTFNKDTMLLSNTTSGSASTYYCDYTWVNNSQVDYALRGGASLDGSVCGAFSLFLSDPSWASGWSIGLALSCKPLS